MEKVNNDSFVNSVIIISCMRIRVHRFRFSLKGLGWLWTPIIYRRFPWAISPWDLRPPFCLTDKEHRFSRGQLADYTGFFKLTDKPEDRHFCR